MRHLRSLLLAVPLVAAGCGTEDLADLTSYRESVLARPATPIVPLPQPRPPQLAGQVSRDRDPFASFARRDVPPVVPPAELPVPPHVAQALEKFALDSLRMVGSLEQGDAKLGLVLAPDGIVRQVGIGDYLGTNFGRVVAVAEDGIDVTENFAGSGIWLERPARLALTESL